MPCTYNPAYPHVPKSELKVRMIVVCGLDHLYLVDLDHLYLVDNEENRQKFPNYFTNENNEPNPMSLVQTFKNLFKSEPELTYTKLGVLDAANNLTSDGKELFNQWLWDNFSKLDGDFFKLCQTMLAEQEKDK